jgi:transcriptional regulator with XRE-family HTH domain
MVGREEDDATGTYARRVGERLRDVRQQKRLSLQAVEARSDQEFKASVLGAYERGERAISVLRLQRLARFYRVPVDQLLPRDVGPDLRLRSSPDDIDLNLSRAEHEGRSSEAQVTIDVGGLDGSDAPERELLQRYLAMIQVQRRDFDGRMITVRADDVRILAFMLQTTPDGLRRRLDDLRLRL